MNGVLQEEILTAAYFDVPPRQFAWTPDVVQSIEARRAALDGVLLFDILLRTGGIENTDTLYPPRDADSLNRLLEAIERCTYDRLKKDTLLYYLLRWHRDERETYYGQAKCIPPQFAALADACWYLDVGEDVPVRIRHTARLRIMLITVPLIYTARSVPHGGRAGDTRLRV